MTVKGIATSSILLLLTSTCVLSAESGDWTYGRSDDQSMFYAFTTNDSGAILGEWCSAETGNCAWMIGTTTGCEHDSSYPVLANADQGSAPVTISCSGKIEGTELTRYLFTNFKDIENLVRKSQRIGFAMPMQEGQFKVVRFSLSGESNAVTSMEQLVSRHVKSSKPSTKDTVL